MNMDNMTQAERALYYKQNVDPRLQAAQELIEDKVVTGYPKGLTNISSTYNSSTHRITFTTAVHYLSIYVSQDCWVVFNESAADAASNLGTPTTSYWLDSATGRHNFSFPKYPITTLDFKANSSAANVYVTAFAKATQVTTS